MCLVNAVRELPYTDWNRLPPTDAVSFTPVHGCFVSLFACAYAHMCVRVRVRACVHVCVHVRALVYL